MAIGINNNLYVASGNSDQVLEYNLNNGAYLGKFENSLLKFPTGIIVRPAGTPRAGNLLVTSRYRNPADPNDFDKILEFDRTTRQLLNPGGVFVSGLVQPVPLAWGLDGHLLVADRSTTELAPLYADRILKWNRTSGAYLGTFTAPADDHLHVATFLLRVEVELGAASGDFDGDGDVDLRDAASLQRCFGADGAECLDVFDDDLNGEVDAGDLPGFHLLFNGPTP
jgi:hypothetical protein